jgi:predicted nucleic acid-binding protein
LIFLDINVVSEVMRLRPQKAVVEWLRQHEAELALSTVVIAEISSGIECMRPAERPPRLAGHLAAIRRQYAERLHPFDEDAALIYGVIIGEATRAGRKLSMADGMIAATALRHNAALATRNVEDFAFLGLEVMNPWD